MTQNMHVPDLRSIDVRKHGAYTALKTANSDELQCENDKSNAGVTNVDRFFSSVSTVLKILIWGSSNSSYPLSIRPK